jgi:hypothetical protein
MGDFSRLCGRRPATDVGVRAQFGRSAFGGRRITSCTTCPRASRTLSGAIGSYA